MKTGGRNTKQTRGSVVDKVVITTKEVKPAKLNSSLDCVANDNECKCSLESLTVP